MKKKQILTIALIVSAIASVAAYVLIRKRLNESDDTTENDAQDDDYDFENEEPAGGSHLGAFQNSMG